MLKFISKPKKCFLLILIIQGIKHQIGKSYKIISGVYNSFRGGHKDRQRWRLPPWWCWTAATTPPAPSTSTAAPSSPGGSTTRSRHGWVSTCTLIHLRINYFITFAAVRVQEVGVRRQEGHPGRRPLRLPHLRTLLRHAAARIRQN